MSDEKVLFTCLSCSIAFLSPEEQRLHYRSDHHRYNMKRRVASLPPISASLFGQRVLERKAETAVTSSLKDLTCDICNKFYSTENAYRSHIQSKRHKEKELKSNSVQATALHTLAPQAERPSPESQTLPIHHHLSLQDLSDDTNFEDGVNQSIDEKIAAARSRLSSMHCLFCPQESTSLDNNLTHMSLVHSFFIPDADYLIDIQGLIKYLGEKIAVGNVCIFCNTKSREFRTLEAVRRHMIDKCHCKIVYESESDRLEISDYYDFTSSYPEIGKRSKCRAVNDAVWEDVSDDGDGEDVDEVVDDSHSEAETDSSDSEDGLFDNQITYGDSHLELVLPSGARIGHRTLRRYYGQSFPDAARAGKPEDPNSGAALVRRLLSDKNAALVPCKGGFGAFGSGTQVVKARNRGEAREAGRHVREFRDQRRREDFKTKVGFIHNSQKHFRDPLLQ